MPVLIERLIDSRTPGERLTYGHALHSTGAAGRAAVSNLAANTRVASAIREFASYLVATWPPSSPMDR